MRTRLFSFTFALGVCLALLFVVGTNAQKKAGQDTKPAAQNPAKTDDEPVAVTAKVPRETLMESKVTTSDQFGNFRYPVINNKGEIAFLALFSASAPMTPAGQSIFVRGADANWKVTREGEKAVNLAESILGMSMPTFNDNGDLTFYAGFGSNGKPAQAFDPNDPNAPAAGVRSGALYVKGAGGLKSVLKLGDEVPNMPSHFSGISNPSTNNKGVTMFVGTYTDPDGRGVFLVDGSNLKLVVRSGQKIGNGEEGTFSEHYYPSTINDRNEIAFMARIGDKSAIFVARPQNIELIAMGGRPSPVKDAKFIGFGNRAPAINSKGEVAFVAFYDGADAGRGLFFKGSGPAQTIARSGETGPGGAAFTDFLSPAINARGDIAFIGKMGPRNQGIFIKTAKGIETVALLEQKIPGAKEPNEIFNNFTQPSINDRGEVVFYAQTKNAEVGIFIRDEKGVLKTLVKRGDTMPK